MFKFKCKIITLSKEIKKYKNSKTMIIKTSPDEVQKFLTDASNYKGNCDAVYFPESAEEISSILKEANSKKISVTVAGNGTGLTGACVPEDGIVISTEKLNRIIEINPGEMYAIVEPAVVLKDFQETVMLKKLMYPPDPTERNCFIGGTVSTNASGEKTFKYGPTRDYVLELEIILADGDVLNLSRGSQKADGKKFSLQTKSERKIEFELAGYKMPAVKNASGYYYKENMDAIDLFIGSEGTLGIFSKIKLKLVPLPENIISCVIFFNDEMNALNFISKAREISFNTKLRSDLRCLEALALEFFDERALNFLREDYSQIPGDAKAGVWFEQEVTHQNEDSFFEEWMDLIKEFNGDEESAWFALNDSDKKKIQDFRHFISAKINDIVSKNNVKKLGTDVAVPDDKFYELYFSSRKMVEEAGLDFVAYGHFGNSHIHLNILPKNMDEYGKGKMVYHEICKTAVRLCGTVSAEHGIGKAKRDYLLEMYGEKVIRQMIEMKKVFDPNMILGRGNIFKIDD